jgi:hypothetical protein
MAVDQDIDEGLQELEPELDARPIDPNRIEVIYQNYLVKMAAYLASHLFVRHYRKAVGLKEYKLSDCKAVKRFLPMERIDLYTGRIPGRPNWTKEEIWAWMDEEARKDEEADAIELAKLQVRGGRFGSQRGIAGLLNVIALDKAE